MKGDKPMSASRSKNVDSISTNSLDDIKIKGLI